VPGYLAKHSRLAAQGPGDDGLGDLHWVRKAHDTAWPSAQHEGGATQQVTKNKASPSVLTNYPLS